MNPQTKTCTTCKKVKPLEEFYKKAKSKKSRDGRQESCSECAREYQRSIRVDPSRRSTILENQRRSRLKSAYGLTVELFEEMLASQGGGCAVCGDLPEPGKSLHVDHDHSCCSGERSCGKCVRGLLCSNCNLLLGLASDSPSLLRSAITYLSRFGLEGEHG